MKNILIIDDDPDQREFLKCIFEMEGHEIREAPNGRAALSAIHKESPDIVITDVFMPEMDGLETIAKLKALNPNIKIIAMSGGGLFSHMDYLEYADTFGADAVIAKPFQIDKMIDLIGSLSC